MQKIALILLAAGVAAISSGGAVAQHGAGRTLMNSVQCPKHGNSREPFYNVTAVQSKDDRPVIVSGEYRMTERNSRLSLTKASSDESALSLNLRRRTASHRQPGCLHFGGSFEAAATVQDVKITDWRNRQVTVHVARPGHTHK